ncbi:hypothetical protein [Serratia phage PCH45]|uniref:hypothetical protein n=1 Tax=Serratia phage PCH45 TaxID=2608368 RepID=UPI0012AA4E78|nr:hypothetical protein [Serratia phage PCH45]
MSLELDLEDDAQYGLVLYTDGGKDTKSSAAGWGVHGYLYPVFDKKEKFKKDKGAFGQYGYVNGQKTDKTFKPGERLVEAGKLYKLIVNEPNSMPSEPVTPTHFFDFYEGIPDATISVVEIKAMEEALRLIASIPQLKQAVIVADSEYVCLTLTEYIFAWVKNNWARKNNPKPIEHVERWKSIWENLNAIRDKGVTVRIGWTRSHVGEPGNEAADYNATKGKVAVLNSLEGKRDVIVAKDYGQKKKLSNRLLEQRWWYGINNELTTSYDDFAGKYVYFFGNHGKAEEEDDLIGKYTSTAKLAIMVSPEKEPVLEMLHDYLFDRFYEEVGLVTLGYLEHITNTERYAQLAKEGKSVLYPKGRDNCIQTPDGVPVMKELRPTFHGLRLLDSLKWHLGLLKRFVDGDGSVTVTDITDIVYDTVDNGKKVTVKTADCINPPNKTVSLEVGYSCMGNVGTKKIPFKMGLDIPLRNTLNAIADESVRVYAITWQRSRNEFRYGTIVKCGEDLLLTCSLSSNLVTLVSLK